MSYDVQLFRIETKHKEQASKDESFFDKTENLEPFTQTQKEELKERLLNYDYEFVKEDQYGTHFTHVDDMGITALLTNHGLYFKTTWNDDGIFEIGMTASEFTDTDEYAKYDPQNKGWEEL